MQCSSDRKSKGRRHSEGLMPILRASSDILRMCKAPELMLWGSTWALLQVLSVISKTQND